MMQPWFTAAKLGIFIHWGIYAVRGIPESWSFFNGQISHADYLAQLSGFTARRYDPEAWARLFQAAGARYAVLTAKHHDGVALWDTRQNDLSVVQQSPAGRDLVEPYCAALRRRGLKVGLYYSHLDWSHPDYATMFNEPFPGEPWRSNRFAYPQPPHGAEPERWARFLRFHRGQLKELCTRFRPDVLWFDGDWDRSEEMWDMKGLRRQLHRWSPGVVLNSRMKDQGDFATPEQGQPFVPPSGPWEYNLTLNDSWGFQHHDRNFKPVDRIIRLFVETVAMGGNMLLDIGPRADGSIPQAAVSRLLALGRWNRRHAEAIWGTTAGLPAGHHYGPSTISEDRRTVYLFLFDAPRHGVILKGIRSRVRRASLVGGRRLRFSQGAAQLGGVPSPVAVDVPARGLDPHCAVVKIELDAPLELYAGHGAVITQN